MGSGGERHGDGLSAAAGTATVRVQHDADAAAPTPVTGLAASASSTPAVTLSWVAATDDRRLAGYEVRRNGTKIGIAKALSYTDSCAGLASCPLVAGNTYTYDVYAYDAAGKLSVQASIAVTIPGSDTTPPPPSAKP